MTHTLLGMSNSAYARSLVGSNADKTNQVGWSGSGWTDGRTGSDKVGEQASAACRHRPQFVVLLIVNFVGTDPIKDICL